MKVGVPKEVRSNERRVALVPESVTKLTAAGIEVLVQAGAGENAYFLDDSYVAAGATITPDAQALLGSADVVVKVQRPNSNDGQSSPEIAMMRSGSVLIAFLQPLFNPEQAKELAERGITSFSMDAVPDKIFHGKITELASVVHTKSINQPAKVFDAQVALLDPDPELMRPGMSVNAEILITSEMGKTQ